MAYIPPHKRYSNVPEKLSPTTPELIAPRFKRDTNFKPGKRYIDRSGKIVHANNVIFRLLMVGSTEGYQLPASVRLQRISMEAFERRMGEKPLALVRSHLMTDETNDPSGSILKRPWASISGKLLQDLLSAFEIMKNEMDFDELQVRKPMLVARFGSVLFHGDPSVNLVGIKECEVTEATTRQQRLKRFFFYKNVPPSYLKNVVDVVAPEIGVDFNDEKHMYHVKLLDSTRQDELISCKCSVTTDNRLELRKVQLNPIRYMVADIAYLEKSKDMRLMFCAKRILTSLTDDEKCSIRGLINSAVLDSNVKGGLRWPLGKASSGVRYSVVGVWHTISKAFSSPSLRLKIIHTDRFDFKISNGEATNDIVLKLKGVVSELQKQKSQDSVSVMLEDFLKLIWNHFLNDEHSLQP